MVLIMDAPMTIHRSRSTRSILDRFMGANTKFCLNPSAVQGSIRRQKRTADIPFHGMVIQYRDNAFVFPFMAW